jgi:molecular chaperone HtpG
MTTAEQFTFKAEIQQLLNILIHSLYTDREIFLRELVSNASDALTKVQFEQLTNQNVVDADAPLEIRITADEEAGTLTISDTGIGMNREEMAQNLGVIAHSGAKAFVEALKDRKNGDVQDLIGQFGVGFYSAFMAADRIRVVSRSYRPEDGAWAWESDGSEAYTLEPAERANRGTDIILTLKEDAREFVQPWKLKDIIRRHSDYIAFPIYVGDDTEATNKQTAIWRQDPKEVSAEQYNDFYKMLTMDFTDPLHHIHMRADVPLQFYALLYIPSSAEPNMFSLRREPGLKLYARKVLIQEYTTELLPEYLQFVQGVVDSEDLPLSVSRESVQATRVIANLKKTLTNKVLNELKRLAKNDRETYLNIFDEFGRFIKQGVTVSPGDRAELEPLLFFNTTRSNEVISLSEYVERMAPNQTDIYYILGEDLASASRSPHLDAFRQRGIEVVYMTDPVDPIMLMGLTEFGEHKLRNVDEADIDLSEIGELQEPEPQAEPLTGSAFDTLKARFVAVLGDRVQDVRESRNLVGSPARLVSEEAGPNRNMYRVQRLLDREYELPVKILELNPRHPLLHNLSQMLASQPSPIIDVVIEQVFETALLQEGLHPDPASMANRLTKLMQAATGTPVEQLGFSAEAGEAEADEAAAEASPTDDSEAEEATSAT